MRSATPTGSTYGVSPYRSTRVTSVSLSNATFRISNLFSVSMKIGFHHSKGGIWLEMENYWFVPRGGVVCCTSTRVLPGREAQIIHSLINPRCRLTPTPSSFCEAINPCCGNRVTTEITSNMEASLCHRSPRRITSFLIKHSEGSFAWRCAECSS